MSLNYSQGIGSSSFKLLFSASLIQKTWRKIQTLGYSTLISHSTRLSRYKIISICQSESIYARLITEKSLIKKRRRKHLIPIASSKHFFLEIYWKWKSTSLSVVNGMKNQLILIVYWLLINVKRKDVWK